MITTSMILAYLIIGIALVSYENHRGCFDDTTFRIVRKPSDLCLGFCVLLWPIILTAVLGYLFITSLGKIPERFEAK